MASQVMEQLWTSWDTACTTAVRAGFVRIGFEELLAAPAKSVADLPFVASPTVLVTSILLYLSVVCSSVVAHKIRGKEIKRDGPVLKTLVQLHNVFLVGLSLYMCGGILLEAVKNNYTLWGNDYDPDEKGLAKFIYIFYLSKIYEFLDTVIMIAKGNMRQVTFLHVYHHITISIIWWSIVYVAPGGDAYYSAALNSFVHVVMYSYYLLATMVGKNEKARKKYLWWGRYLTQFQMTQFLTNTSQAVYDLATNKYNDFLARLLLVYMLTLLALFGNFYISKYNSSTKRPPKAILAQKSMPENILDGESSPNSEDKIKSI